MSHSENHSDNRTKNRRQFTVPLEEGYGDKDGITIGASLVETPQGYEPWVLVELVQKGTVAASEFPADVAERLGLEFLRTAFLSKSSVFLVDLANTLNLSDGELKEILSAYRKAIQ